MNAILARFQEMENFATKSSNHWKMLFACIAMVVVMPARALVLASETFDASMNGWTDRDAGELSSSHSAGFGLPAGSLHGSFAFQAILAFESDAFRAGAGASGGAFSGNLYSTYGSFSSLSFGFYAEDVLPSSFIMRIGDGSSTFLYNMTPQLSSPGQWTTISVPLNAASWIGGTPAQFSNVLGSVSFIDVQLARNGAGAQDYFLDNFSINWDEANTTVPEPQALGLMLIGMVMLRLVRKHQVRKQRLASLR